MLITDNSLVQLLRAGFLPKFCVNVLKKPSTVVESMLMLCAGRPILLNCFFCLILQYSLEVTRRFFANTVTSMFYCHLAVCTGGFFNTSLIPFP